MLIQTTPQVPVDVLLGPYGLLGFLIFVVVLGGLRRWWVYGWQWQAERDEKLYWRDVALKALGTAEEASKVAHTAVRSGPTTPELEAMARQVDDARSRGELP